MAKSKRLQKDFNWYLDRVRRDSKAGSIVCAISEFEEAMKFAGHSSNDRDSKKLARAAMSLAKSAADQKINPLLRRFGSDMVAHLSYQERYFKKRRRALLHKAAD